MKLYKIYDDGDGHQYLVPQNEIETVENIEAIGDEDALNDLLDTYQRLEGQPYFVVLEGEI